jgi:hypothetical protein
MTDELCQRMQEVKPVTARVLQWVCLSIVCITGIVCIAATPPPAMVTNPHPTATRPYSSQINQKLVELHETELEYEETTTSDDGKPFTGGIPPTEAGRAKQNLLKTKINKIKIELAQLRAKAAAQAAEMKKKAEAMESQTGGCFTADMWVLTEDGAKPSLGVVRRRLRCVQPDHFREPQFLYFTGRQDRLPGAQYLRRRRCRWQMRPAV